MTSSKKSAMNVKHYETWAIYLTMLDKMHFVKQE